MCIYLAVVNIYIYYIIMTLHSHMQLCLSTMNLILSIYWGINNAFIYCLYRILRCNCCSWDHMSSGNQEHEDIKLPFISAAD